MRVFRGFVPQARQMALMAMLIPAAFGIAFIVLELGNIAAA